MQDSWLQKSIDAGEWLDEAPLCVTHIPGLEASRSTRFLLLLSRSTDEHTEGGLLQGLRFRVPPGVMHLQISGLVRAAGGSVVAAGVPADYVLADSRPKRMSGDEKALNQEVCHLLSWSPEIGTDCVSSGCSTRWRSMHWLIPPCICCKWAVFHFVLSLQFRFA